MYQKYSGFTIIEVLIAAVLIGIIAVIALPNFVNYKNDADIKISAQNIATVQRVMRYYVALNDLKEGDPLSVSSFIGTASNMLLDAPESPFLDGGYSYMVNVPPSGVCYATETSSSNGSEVNAFAISNKFCK